MKVRLAAPFLALSLFGCGAVPTQPADPAVTQRIVQACLASGLFKMGAGFGLSFAGPPGEIANQVLSAGIDRVCANPAAFAADVSTVEWVARNLSSITRRPT